MRTLTTLTLTLVTTMSMLQAPARAATGPAGFSVEVIVDGVPLREYAARGTRYVEALQGREYAIRLRNPLGVRVAVALSVDGLNTIDARRTSAAEARKWVLGPYETITISGWQTGRNEARRFYFTTEEASYASRLGRASDLGVISAVFFRERAPEPPQITSAPAPAPDSGGRGANAEAAAPAAGVARKSAPADDYAATGIGREVTHRVERVWLELEPRPAASLSVRYEYRPQLVELGVLPRPADRLGRRERARGFEGFCPVP